MDICKNCKHYEYRDTKQNIKSDFNWGYCHKTIPLNPNTKEEQFDLIEYFEVLETDFCSSFIDDNLLPNIKKSLIKNGIGFVFRQNSNGYICLTTNKGIDCDIEKEFSTNSKGTELDLFIKASLFHNLDIK